MSAVIDHKAFKRIAEFIDIARQEGDQIVFGGECDDSRGYFVKPTCIRVTNPKSKLLTSV